MLYMKITKSVSDGDFGPAEAAGRSQTRPVEPSEIDLVIERGTKIFAIAYSYGECVIKSGRHIF